VREDLRTGAILFGLAILSLLDFVRAARDVRHTFTQAPAHPTNTARPRSFTTRRLFPATADMPLSNEWHIYNKTKWMIGHHQPSTT
jgi:hypothetical protein